MRTRIGLALAAIAIGVLIACLPFSANAASYKGPGHSPSWSCGAPIRIGWTTTHAYKDIPGGTEYDSSQECGQDGRERLLIAGAFVLVGIVGLSVTLWRQRRTGYPLPMSW